MDARIDPLDEQSHYKMIDLMRQADFTEAVVLFGRLVRLAYLQGQIDAYGSTMRRLNGDGSLEEDIRGMVSNDQ